MRKAYRNLYLQKLANKSVDADELRDLEIHLAIPTLIELREWAKLKVQKKPSSSWLGGWFSASPNDPNNENVFDEEDRRRLSAIIADSSDIKSEHGPVWGHTFFVNEYFWILCKIPPFKPIIIGFNWGLKTFLGFKNFWGQKYFGVQKFGVKTFWG